MKKLTAILALLALAAMSSAGWLAALPLGLAEQQCNY